MLRDKGIGTCTCNENNRRKWRFNKTLSVPSPLSSPESELSQTREQKHSMPLDFFSMKWLWLSQSNSWPQNDTRCSLRNTAVEFLVRERSYIVPQTLRSKTDSGKSYRCLLRCVIPLFSFCRPLTPSQCIPSLLSRSWNSISTPQHALRVRLSFPSSTTFCSWFQLCC